jgi:hypothetical protein
MRYRISGNEVVEYEAEVEADSQEEAEEIFIQEILPDLEPSNIHGWQWHETQILNKENA